MNATQSRISLILYFGFSYVVISLCSYHMQGCVGIHLSDQEVETNEEMSIENDKCVIIETRTNIYMYVTLSSKYHKLLYYLAWFRLVYQKSYCS